MVEPRGSVASSSYRFGRFELNAAVRQLFCDGNPVTLGARAFDVLLALVERRERVVTKDELLEAVWPGLVVEENNLQVQISALRKALGVQAISTIPGRGYQFTLALNEAQPVPAPEPSATDLTHRLTAILAADVAGYSRMMGINERATVASLDRVRAIFRKEIEANGGRVVDMAGDSVLALFESATGAVIAALAVQHQVEAAAAAQLEERRMRVRIGVHLGDVFVKPDLTVYGNGVNVAARLQALARLGGIAISQTLYDTVKRKLTLQAEFAGPQSFKNIAEPVPTWHIVAGSAELPVGPTAAPSPSPEEPKPALAPHGAQPTRWVVAAIGLFLLAAVGGAWWLTKREPVNQARVDPKSIAVLPFANMSPDKDNVYFADGVQEDLLTQLSLLGELKVVSRTSVAEYRDTKKNLRQIGAELGVASLVEGAVRRSGDRVRVTVQLIDARTDQHIWGNTYDRELKDIFAIQSELSKEIARALKVSLTPGEEARLRRKPTENLAAYDLLLLHQNLFLRATSFGAFYQLDERIALLSRAVELDPKFALAWARLGAEHARAYFYSVDRSAPRLAKAQEAINRARALAPDDVAVRNEIGNFYYYGLHDFVRAAQYLEDLLQAAPNNVDALVQLSWLRRRQGHWPESNRLLEKALAVDPRNLVALRDLGQNLDTFRHWDERLAVQRRIVAIVPDELDEQCRLRQIEWIVTGSFATYDAWKKTLPPEVVQTSWPIWFMEMGRAASKRDFDAGLRLIDAPPPGGGRYYTLNEGRALLLLAKGERSRARAIAQSALRSARSDSKRNPDNFINRFRVVYDLAFMGEREAALAEYERYRAIELAKPDAVEASSLTMLEPFIYAALGDREKTLELLAQLLESRSLFPWLDWRLEWDFAFLMDDPRFQALASDPAHNAPLPFVDWDVATILRKK